MEHIDLEAEEDSRVSLPIFISPPQSPSQRTSEIDHVQQEIYDYIESLEKIYPTRTSTLNQEEVQFSKPQEPPMIKNFKTRNF